MKLLTEELKKTIPKIFSQETVEDPIVHCKFFTPDSSWTWFVIEMNEMEDGDVEFFGLVDGLEEEIGAFLLSELESARGPWGLKIERDLHFIPKPLSQVRRKE